MASSSPSFAAQLAERTKGVLMIIVIVTIGFYTYPPVLAFLIVGFCADEFFRVAQLLKQNMNTYANQSSMQQQIPISTSFSAATTTQHVLVAPIMAVRSSSSSPSSRSVDHSKKERIAYVTLCVSICVAALVSHEFMTSVAMVLSLALIVYLMFKLERQSHLNAMTTTTAVLSTDLNTSSSSSHLSPLISPSASSSSSSPSSSSSSLFLHAHSPLLSAHEFCSILILVFGFWYASWMFSHGVLILLHPSGFTTTTTYTPTSGALNADGTSHSSSPPIITTVNTFGVTRLIYLIFVTAGGENGGLFLGRLLGRSKLCPRISPGKTREGFLAQIVVSVVSSVLLVYDWSPCSMHLGVPSADAVGLGVILGIIGGIGDLFESLMKRSVGLKDCGTIIPGAGGMLDRMDGLIFNFPTFYFYLQFVHPYTNATTAATAQSGW